MLNDKLEMYDSFDTWCCFIRKIKKGLYLDQSWRRGVHEERCPAVQSPAAGDGGPATAAAVAFAPSSRAERCRLETRWAPAKTAGKGWR